jgi:hypothetical protein
MAHRPTAGLGLIVGALVFLMAALWPSLRGGDVNATLLALAAIFLVVGAMKMRASRTTPPAA